MISAPAKQIILVSSASKNPPQPQAEDNSPLLAKKTSAWHKIEQVGGDDQSIQMSDDN